MDLGMGLLVALILLPAIGGLVAWATKGIGLRPIVLSTVLVTAISSIALFAYIEVNDLPSISLSSDDLFGLGILVPILDVVLATFFIYIGYRRRSWVIIIMAAIALIVPIYLDLQTEGELADPVLYMDGLSLTMILITGLVGSLICIYALKYMDRDQARPRFFLFMLLFLGAMTGAVLSNDMLWLFFFWEVTTLCSFMLIGHERTEQANRAADRALLYTLGGGVAFCIAMLFIFWEEGVLELSALPEGEELSSVVLVAIGLLIVAALTKSAQVPFQRWLVGAMVAPTPVSALLHSATMVNLGVYLLLRLSPQIISTPHMGDALALVGGFSFLVTTLLALRQSNAKRVLAYSTIANLALIVACVGIGTPLSIAAGMVILIFHAITKALLFLTVGVVKHETGSEDIESMIELRQRMPFIALALYAGVFLMLLPAFGLFAGKWMLSEATIDNIPFLFLFALGLGTTVAYYAKWLGRALASGPVERETEIRWDQPSPWFTVPLMILIVGAFVLSLSISLVMDSLISPYLLSFTADPVEGDLLGLETPLGTLPVLAVFLVVMVSLFLLFYTIRPSKEELGQAYTCGEGGDFRVVGSYLYSEAKESILLLVSDIVGLALLISLFSMVALTGVPL
jgi:ech hydrogenase subunit A